MKTSYILLLIMGLTLFSCKKDLPVYNLNGEDAIGFAFNAKEDSTTYYSFVYDEKGISRKTIYINLRTLGFTANYDRPITIKQVPVEDPIEDHVSESVVDVIGNAIPGVHYLPQTAPEVTGTYVVKAGEAMVALPIVVLKDPSLENGNYILRFVLEENDFFKLGFPNTLKKDVIISTRPIKPKTWNNFTWGTYGYEKHSFMIRVTNQKWDDAWFAEIGLDNTLREFWKETLVRELEKENAKRETEGKGKLTEKDGTVVKIGR